MSSINRSELLERRQKLTEQLNNIPDKLDYFIPSGNSNLSHEEQYLSFKGVLDIESMAITNEIKTIENTLRLFKPGTNTLTSNLPQRKH